MNSFTSPLNRIISAVFAFIFIPLSVFTYGIDLISADKRTDISSVNIAGPGAYFRSQGITTDGEYLYFSSKTTLIKTEADGKTAVNSNLCTIPDNLKNDYGIKHIGGLSFYNGKIYAGMEDSKVFKNPIIGVFSAETLQLEKYYRLGETDESGNLIIQKGVPWVAVDPETGLLYCANHHKQPEKLLIFDTESDMKKVGELKLSDTVYSIQGAEFYSGTLFAATNDGTQSIYTIDINNGECKKLTDRNLTPGSEGEGMTIFIKDGKPVITAIDMGPLFVNAFVREYELKID